VAVVGGMAAVVLVLPLGLAAAGLMLVMLGFNVAYSLRPVRLSWRGGLALALLPLGYVGLTMGLGYLAAGTPLSPLLLAFIAMCYLQFLARISLKDYRDVTGDRHHGKRTFLIRHGSNAVVALALTCHSLATLAGTIWLYFISFPLAAGFIGLGSAAGVFLINLRAAPNWSQQRPWITSYGRLVSGQLTLLLIGSLIQASIIDRGGPKPVILTALIAGTFLWSANRVGGWGKVQKSD
jgi:4-hydroxybenzoate polyprenyltransferase